MRLRTVRKRKSRGKRPLPVNRNGMRPRPASRSGNRPHLARRMGKRESAARPRTAPRKKSRIPAGFGQGRYEQGVEEGIYRGGEAMLETLLPADGVIPHVTVAEVLAAGVAAMHHRVQPILTAAAVAERIGQALDTRSPLSVVRLGDGELLTLAQQRVLDPEEVRRRGPFLPYAGVHVPDLAARDLLLHSIRQADIVGIPLSRQRNFQPLAFEVFRAYGIDCSGMTLTDSLVNYVLHHTGHLPLLTNGRRVLIIGNAASELSHLLAAHGVQIAGAIAPVGGMKEVSRVTSRLAGVEFDLALVSAGIAAVPIAVQIATGFGKVALDFGHLADWLVEGKVAFL